MKVNSEKQKRHVLFIGITSIFLLVLLASFCLGKYPVAPAVVIKAMVSKILPIEQTWSNQINTILFNIRFPRIVMAAVIGAGIATAGAAYQALFQNPMISQDILGASQGAAFGAALGLFLSFTYEQVIGISFLFGLLAVGAVLALNRFLKNGSIIVLVLIGMMVSTLFSSAVSFLKLVGDPTNTLPAITYWLMGSLSTVKNQDLFFSAPLILIGLLPLLLFRWRLTVLSLGEEEATALGIDTRFLRLIFIFSATLITAAAVSVSGLIGWVGLIVPHFSRMLLGEDYRYNLPATAILGSTFLLLVDNAARLIATSEIPIGILTSFIGAPIFIVLIAKNSKAREG